MPGLIHDKWYQQQKEQLYLQVPAAEMAVEALEWELIHTCDFQRFPLVEPTLPIEIRYHQSNMSKVAPAVIVIFGFEVNGGERKVVLHDVKLSEPVSDADE